MTDSIAAEFTDSAQGNAQRAELEIKNLVASVFRQTTSDTLFGWNDTSLNLNKEDMEKLYKYFGPRNVVDIAIGDRQVPHHFDVRMRNHGNDRYTLALYEQGEHVGTAKTPDIDISPRQIYESNPLQEKNLPTQ